VRKHLPQPAGWRHRYPLFPWPLAAVAATALVVVLPFLAFGSPSGHDFEFHLNTWMDAAGQWKQGIIYPRWAALAQWGYGDARFIFYPPLSWMLGAALGTVLPWKWVPGIYIWLALTLSGCSMYVVARQWLDQTNAICAAALYAANPYYLIIVYWRSAFAELLAGALLPWLLLYTWRLQKRGSSAVLPLALTLAAAWLTNIPAAVMITYSFVLLLALAAVTRRSFMVLGYGAVAAFLGAGLAAFFLLPAACEKSWVSLAQVLSPGVRPVENFLFTAIGDRDHDRFNLLVSVVASAEIFLTVLALAFLSRRTSPTAEKPATAFQNSDDPDSTSPAPADERGSESLVPFLVLPAAPALLMFSITAFAWAHLPLLRFLQFPWRWLLCLSLILAVSVPLAFRRTTLRLLICFALLAVLVFCSVHIQAPSWEDAAGSAAILESHRTGQGYKDVDEYIPADADNYEIKQDAPLITASGQSQASFGIQAWTPESRLLRAVVARPGILTLRLFNYPSWLATVNGHPVSAESDPTTGQMMVPVSAGENQIRISFTRTWDRTAGGIISLVFILALLVARVRFSRRVHRHDSSHPRGEAASSSFPPCG